MSKKFRDPKKNVVPLKSKSESPAPQQPQITPLGGDPDSLVGEWRRLQGVQANVQLELNKRQEIINKTNGEMQQLQQTGLQVHGALQTLSRILSGMGVDPNKYEVSEPLPEEPFDPEPEDDFEEEEVNSIPEEAVSTPAYRRAARRRFHR